MNEQAPTGSPPLLDAIPTLPIRIPELPEPLAGLDRLAANLYWTWCPEAERLFRGIAPDLWSAGAGPVEVLRSVDLAPLARDAAFADEVRRLVAAFDAYMAGGATWHDERGRFAEGGPVAYFCAEYGLHASFNQYSGGLGILAGDHCKEASDMGLPFLAVGLFYRRGFFRQLIDGEGRQEHLYPVIDPAAGFVARVQNPCDGKPLTVSVEMPGRTVHAAVWRAAVGRVPLLMLDTDVPENAPEDRPITSQLYTNGRDMRLHQEMILGVGGVRALRALGIVPSAWHLNEGHSAFLLLERLREQAAEGKRFDAAREIVRGNSIITIHTPVPAGNERFGAEHAGSLIAPVLAGTGLEAARILELGLGEDGDPGVFDMTAFALRHCRAANGVSRLHGRTADATWRAIGGFPLLGVTNGVHMPTWLGPQVAALLAQTGDVGQVDGRALWEAHQAQKAALIAFARARLFAQHARHGEGPAELRECLDAFDPDAFLIGFARRFATYKRAALLFSDEDRLERILTAPNRPVQIVFAGKAHPADRGGQALIEQVYRKTRSPRFRGMIFLLEDYDMAVGRALVQGVDIWLNTPRRPLEASGTSGMKAAANGAPNVSVLDGWWDEAYQGGERRTGWAIGGRDTLDDTAEQDRRDATELYRLLEEEVIPAYHERDAAGLPVRWLEIMKSSIESTVAAFSTRRMLEDYWEQMLAPVSAG